MVTPSFGSTGPFTGRGFVSMISFSSAQFIFSAPKSTQYEMIMRYEVCGITLLCSMLLCLIILNCRHQLQPVVLALR